MHMRQPSAEIVDLFDSFLQANPKATTSEEWALIAKAESALIGALPGASVESNFWFAQAARLLVIGQERAGLNDDDVAACKAIIRAGHSAMRAAA